MTVPTISFQEFSEQVIRNYNNNRKTQKKNKKKNKSKGFKVFQIIDV